MVSRSSWILRHLVSSVGNTIQQSQAISRTDGPVQWQCCTGEENQACRYSLVFSSISFAPPLLLEATSESVFFTYVVVLPLSIRSSCTAPAQSALSSQKHTHLSCHHRAPISTMPTMHASSRIYIICFGIVIASWFWPGLSINRAKLFAEKGTQGRQAVQ